MISLYARIAGNYFKPLGFRIAYALIAVWALLAAWRQSVAHDLGELLTMPIVGFFIFLPTVFVADLGIMYLKEQLATWQSSLVPHYRRPHLIVGALFVVITLCGIPLLFSRIVHVPLFPMIAVCAGGASLAGWLVYDPSLKTLLVFFATLALMCFPIVQEKLGLLVRFPESFMRAILLMLAGSLALFGWIWWQLSRLREEMPQYRGGMGAARSMTEVRPAFQAGWLDAIAGFIARYPAWRIRATYTEPIDSFVSRVQHRRLVSAGGWVPWRLGALWALALLAMLAGINLAFDAHDRMKFIDIAPLVFIISMPAAPIITSSLWIRRDAMLPYEMMLPASRRSFVRQTLASLVWDHISCWMGAIVTSAAIMAIASYLNHSRELIAGDVSDVVVGLAFFFCGQIAAVALIAWTLRFRSTLLSIFTMIIGAALALPPLFLAGSHGIDDRGILISIVSLTVVGLVILFDAYRRWLRVQFE
jgi:hypothetical protein